MKKSLYTMVILGLLIAGFSQPAMAGDLVGPPEGYVYPGYVNAPNWSANPYFTRQSWDFLPVEDPSEPGTYMAPGFPIATEASTHGGPVTVNPYGNPLLIGTGPRIGYDGESLDHAWEWTDYGMGMENDTYYGHIGGMGSGYVIFDIPNNENNNLTKEIWLQYIVYIPRGGAGPDEGTLTGFFLDEPEIDPLTGNPTNDPVGTMLSKEYEMICDTVGYSGYWWRVTEEWQLDSQPGEEWLWFATSGEGGAATLIDSVDIQTRSVEPSTVDTPTFSPDPGTAFTSSLEVTITCTTEDAIIYYTTDGNDPTETSTLYSGTITITETTAFKAKAFKTGWTPSAVAAATYTRTGTVATPGFSPDPGTYASARNVTISCETEGSSIYYTTDGTNPTESSPEYTGPVNISTTTTLKAKAFKQDWDPSNTASGLYTITGTTAMPAFSPPSGTEFTSSLDIEISCSTESATIYYTTDNTNPTESSTMYTGPITITETTAFKAKAFKTGWTPSTVATATYTKIIPGTVATPTFDPAPGTYDSAQSVTITCDTEGATIYYTTDGDDPTEGSTLYTAPVTISATTTLKARAYKTDWDPSDIASGDYTISTTETAATPTLSPAPGTYDSAQSVTITCDTEEATIYYTTDGDDPTEGSTLYTAPVTISATTTLMARAFKTDWDPSDIASGDYTISTTETAATPTLSPAPGTYDSAQSVTIICDTEEATIYYTTDGDDPTEGSTLYTAPVTISATTTLMARAFKTDWDPSNIATGIYTIEEDWSDNPYYTHQIWEFNSLDIDPDTPGWQLPECNEQGDDIAISPGLPGIIQEGNVDPDPPLAPDKLVNSELESYVNDYGTPYLIYAHPLTEGAFDWIWYSMSPPWERCGHYGGMAHTELIFMIPNAEISERHLNLRLQFAEFSRDDAPDAWEVIVGRGYDPETHAILDTQSINMIDEEWVTEIDGGGHPWHSVTQIWEFGEQTSVVYVSISAFSPSATLIDEVVIDTRSVTAIVPPKLFCTSPENGATGVKVNSTVSVTFTKPMDKEITEGAFSISPEVDGEFAWENLDKTMVFIPRSGSDPDYLDCQTVYDITVSKDARDVMGLNLGNDYGFSFTTETYTVPNPTLYGVPEGTVDIDEATITVGGNGSYRYIYQLDNGDLQGPFDTIQTIELSGLSDGEHILSISMEDAHMNWHELDPVAWIVMAPPTVVSTSPGDGKSAPTSTKISVTFSEAMDKESFENDAFSIDPDVPGAITWSGNTMAFTPDENLIPETTYTAAIDTSATDLAGNSLTEPRSWSFTTYVGTTTITCPVEADTYVLMGSMGGGQGYPTRERLMAAGCCGINVCIDSRILVRFDISEIQQLESDQIVKAEVCYYMINKREGVSMEMEPPAPAGTPMYGFIYALDTMSFEYDNVQLDEPFIWTEAEMGNSNWVDYNKKPGYAPGVPMILATHTTGPFSPGRIDITEIVRGWVRGDYENNGIELKDHNDRSYVDLTHGEGFPWYWPSKEESDSTKHTYLRVEVDAERLLITGKTGSLPELLSSESMDLDAEGWSGSYSWHAIGPDECDVTDQVLSNTTGSATTFTAPDRAGLYKITVTDGAETDSIMVGVSDPDAYRPDDEPYELSQTLFPLFMGEEIDLSDQEEIYKICKNTVDNIGTSGIPGSLGKITVINEDGEENVAGGTGGSNAASTAIAIIENPATATQVVNVRDKNGNSVCEIEISEGDIDAGAESKIYVVVTDTGISSLGGASSVYSITLYDENGHKIDDSLINNIVITMNFKTDMIVSDQLRDGTYPILYTEDTGKFFTAEGDDPKGTVPVSDIIEVNYDEGRVKFRMDHLTSFGIRGSGFTEISGGDDNPDLGGGCFINTAARE